MLVDMIKLSWMRDLLGLAFFTSGISANHAICSRLMEKIAISHAL